ncbi:MAG: hypothetical protein ACE15D_00980 [Candidatus Eisenbacteria bacterium]
MKHQKHRTRMIALAALFSTTTLIAAAGAMTYEITVENAVTPGGMEMGQPFSRPVAVVHGAGYSQWAPGGQASPGLELVAREGNPTVLAMEAENNADVYDVVVGEVDPSSTRSPSPSRETLEICSRSRGCWGARTTSSPVSTTLPFPRRGWTSRTPTSGTRGPR